MIKFVHNLRKLLVKLLITNHQSNSTILLRTQNLISKVPDCMIYIFEFSRRKPEVFISLFVDKELLTIFPICYICWY